MTTSECDSWSATTPHQTITAPHMLAALVLKGHCHFSIPHTVQYTGPANMQSHEEEQDTHTPGAE